jgi:hypothetical protein
VAALSHLEALSRVGVEGGSRSVIRGGRDPVDQVLLYDLGRHAP